MARRYAALERDRRRKEEEESLPYSKVDPPPISALDLRSKKRSTYGLQRDYRILEREKKVSSALENSIFCSQLEKILQGQLEGRIEPKPTRPSSEQWPEDTSSRGLWQGNGRKTGPVVSSGSGEILLPINDLQGINASKYTLAERQTRCKLAALYRLVDMFGWSQIIYNHITARAPGEQRHYFINAFGLMYHEVTASNLVRVDLEGKVIDPGTTQLGVNGPGLVLHSAIHRARGDVKCVIHLHNNAAVAVSAMNCGLLPISSEANIIGRASYFDCWTLESGNIEEEIASTLEMNKVLILHNHGVVALGESIEEAFRIAHNLVKACEIQVATMSGGMGNFNQTPQGVWTKCKGNSEHLQVGLKWKSGELEFEALMRMLDNKGYKTGYNYKGLELLQPGKKKEVKDAPSLQQEASQKWDFLEEEKLHKKQLLLKSARGSGKKSQECLEDPPKTPVNGGDHTNPNVVKQRNHMHNQEAGAVTGGLNLLEQVEQTAERVARSTGDAVQRAVKSTENVVQKSSLELAQQTAKQVAKSTSTAVQKLADKTENSISMKRPAEEISQSNTNPVQRFLLDTSDGEESDQDLDSSRNKSLDPLQSVQQATPSAAQSTGVSKIPNGIHTDPRPRQHTNGSVRKLPSLPMIKEQELTAGSLRLPNGLRDSVHHQSSSIPLCTSQQQKTGSVELASDSEYSTTESSEFPPKRTNVRKASIQAHRQSITVDLDLETNPLERMTDTAEIVAQSTGRAVQKLTNSLSDEF